MIIPLTTEEALEFLLENGLTKHQYINIHHLNKARVCDIFPSYSEVQKVKTTFRPTDQLKSQMKNVSCCTLIVSYFDGSTGQGLYKQKFGS